MSANSIYEFDALTNTGNNQSLSDYQGQVLLIVNTASACGFTPQYAGLEKVFQQFKDKGFSVLAFPCNQFGAQEKGSDEEIKGFCDLNFNISFPLYAKIEVNGDDAHPLYKHMKTQVPGFLGSKNIKWNFTKFLVNRDGAVVKRYAPTTKPEAIARDIQALL